ncbi:MAG: hypothetical protein Ct9H300mP9_3710 [Candidatus Neomarinimicrobiota bacterium]|nr:MAG: hypothetical protein Ct9H300mP9_3710 [Candidatus Neomarinimicrobiota bacterium]
MWPWTRDISIWWVIQDKGGVKSFLAGDAFPCNKPKLDPKRNPTGFSVAISKAHDQLVKKIERKGNVNGSTIKKISAGCPIALTLNNVSSVLKTVEVPLESKKDRDMIIEYDAKKNLPFNADDIIYDAIELDQGKNIIGVANADYIDTPAKILSDKNWDIRIWTPAAQTILNVFRWNYPEKKHDIVLIFHIGEIESFLFGYNQGHPDAIVPLGPRHSKSNRRLEIQSKGIKGQMVQARLLQGPSFYFAVR